MSIGDLLGDPSNLASLLANLIRIGRVTSTKPAATTARVQFADRDGLESFDLKVLQRRSGKRKSVSLPDVGEDVVCLFLPTGIEQGFVIGSYYPSRVAPPAASQDIEVLLDEAPARIEYNRAAATANLTIGGSVFKVTPDEIRLESNGSSLVLNAAGAKLNGARVDLNL